MLLCINQPTNSNDNKVHSRSPQSFFIPVFFTEVYTPWSNALPLFYGLCPERKRKRRSIRILSLLLLVSRILEMDCFRLVLDMKILLIKKWLLIENDSIVKSNNGKRVAKGLNKFKPGSANKVFTKEFGPGDFVEWTIISNGNTIR